jgi:hypothetical protein
MKITQGRKEKSWQVDSRAKSNRGRAVLAAQSYLLLTWRRKSFSLSFFFFAVKPKFERKREIQKSVKSYYSHL